MFRFMLKNWVRKIIVMFLNSVVLFWLVVVFMVSMKCDMCCGRFIWFVMCSVVGRVVLLEVVENVIIVVFWVLWKNDSGEWLDSYMVVL